jgi:hypothetical protein
MTPESRNSSLLGNGGKQVPAEINTQATIQEPLSRQRISKYTKIGVLMGTVFSLWSVQSGYKEEFNLKYSSS